MASPISLHSSPITIGVGALDPGSHIQEYISDLADMALPYLASMWGTGGS